MFLPLSSYVMGYKFVVAAVAAGCTSGHTDKGCTRKKVVDGSLLNGRRVVMALIKKNCMRNGRLQWSCQRLDESAHWFATKAVN